MNEDIEQPDEEQEPLVAQPDGKQGQLIEIYKLQAQLADNLSNRRTTIHKFYLLLMSGLALIFPTFFKLPTEVQTRMSIEFVIVGIALLGIPLCMTWLVLISINLRMSMLKYETLKKLEDKLSYPFFKKEWELLENYYGKGKTHWETPYIEILIPIFFFLLFTFLLNAVHVNSPDKFYLKLLTYCPTIIGGAFLGYGIV